MEIKRKIGKKDSREDKSNTENTNMISRIFMTTPILATGYSKPDKKKSSSPFSFLSNKEKSDVKVNRNKSKESNESIQEEQSSSKESTPKHSSSFLRSERILFQGSYKSGRTMPKKNQREKHIHLSPSRINEDVKEKLTNITPKDKNEYALSKSQKEKKRFSFVNWYRPKDAPPFISKRKEAARIAAKSGNMKEKEPKLFPNQLKSRKERSKIAKGQKNTDKIKSSNEFFDKDEDIFLTGSMHRSIKRDNSISKSFEENVSKLKPRNNEAGNNRISQIKKGNRLSSDLQGVGSERILLHNSGKIQKMFPGSFGRDKDNFLNSNNFEEKSRSRPGHHIYDDDYASTSSNTVKEIKQGLITGSDADEHDKIMMFSRHKRESEYKTSSTNTMDDTDLPMRSKNSKSEDLRLWAQNNDIITENDRVVTPTRYKYKSDYTSTSSTDIEEKEHLLTPTRYRIESYRILSRSNDIIEENDRILIPTRYRNEGSSEMVQSFDTLEEHDRILTPTRYKVEANLILSSNSNSEVFDKIMLPSRYKESSEYVLTPRQKSRSSDFKKGSRYETTSVEDQDENEHPSTPEMEEHERLSKVRNEMEEYERIMIPNKYKQKSEADITSSSDKGVIKQVKTLRPFKQNVEPQITSSSTS